MARNDIDYFRQRAETEAAMAASAMTVEAARIHETMARYYRGLVDPDGDGPSLAREQRDFLDRHGSPPLFRNLRTRSGFRG